MKQKLMALVHKYDNSLLLVKTQLDLSVLLGVSISTIKRKYNEIGIYHTDLYVVHIGVNTYDNMVEKNYNRTPKHKVENVYISIDRANSMDNSIKRAIEHQVLAHPISISTPIINDTTVEVDWLEIEMNLSFNELKSYYMQRTEEQLKDSYDYFINRPGSTLRITIINECAKIKQLE